jgi:hypothetical protein
MIFKMMNRHFCFTFLSKQWTLESGNVVAIRIQTAALGRDLTVRIPLFIKVA